MSHVQIVPGEPVNIQDKTIKKMGLDLYLREEPCETCGHQREDFNISYTYNVSPMWYKIYPNDDGMVNIDGMTGEEAYKKLKYAWKYMKEHREEMIKLEPSNGWGSYSGFLEFIEECMAVSLKNPKLKWESWR